MKRRITTLVLALTLATALLLGGLTARPASANSFTLSASQCNYIGNYCHLQFLNGASGTVTISWLKWSGSCGCYAYDGASVYSSGGTWVSTNTYVPSDQQVIQVSINAPARIYYESVGPIYWYNA